MTTLFVFTCLFICSWADSMATSALSRFIQRSLRNQIKITPRRFCSTEEMCLNTNLNGVVLGIYTDVEDHLHPGKFTPTAERFNATTGNRLWTLLKLAGSAPLVGECRVFFGLDSKFPFTVVVGLGKECQGYDAFEQMDEGKEEIRRAAAKGSRKLQKLNVRKVSVESFGHAESAAEGAALGVWLYQEKKNKHKQLHIPLLELHDDCDFTGWQIGLQKAAAQNLARQLTDTPANLMTPTSFAQNAVEVLCKAGVNVEVKVRGWAETNKMHSFLAASAGSCEPPIFLELSYYGAEREERPILLIGKGVTYNSGGLCLKKHRAQKYMRGDMAGAACVVAACRAVAGLQLPINIRGLIPLCENLPGCAAMKPGDIYKAMNGTSIQLWTTDCAGELILADALVYAQNFWPRFIVDIGTMTYDCRSALGASSCGVWSNSEALFEYMLAASMHTGDRIWRFPLWHHFTKLLVGHENCDIQTRGRGAKYGHACKAAAFLQEFVPCGDWLHIDTYGVMRSNGLDFPYLQGGMSGRPTRTIVEFLSQLVCHREDDENTRQ